MRECNYCIMDETVPSIEYDEHGRCNLCKEAEFRYQNAMSQRSNLDSILKKIKKAGHRKKYDCIIGISGGVDSSYVAYYVKKMGLRPLAVHFDNGWDSELAVQNIRVLLEKLEIPLYTYVVEWQEFRDLQLSFLRASTPDIEIPTDHMILGVLYMVAKKYNVKYIISGHNIASESILPQEWSNGHGDWRYIKGIHNQFGKIPLKTYIGFSRLDMVYYQYVKRINMFPILNYLDYDKEREKDFLIKEYNWKDYGGKHFESFYTKFYQSYILPTKFGFDKRKMHLSSLIVSGQLSRDDALKEMRSKLYDLSQIERDITFFCDKMEITRDEFESIMKMPPKTFYDYPNNENNLIGKIIHAFRD